MSSHNIAIVIPCRNEEKYIEKCLYSILNQTYPSNKIKIYVVDGFSADKSREKVAALMDSHSNIFLIDNVKKTTPYALNIGIKNATNAEFIMILGAHAELYSDYLQKAEVIFRQKADISCLGGILENISENKTTEAISFAMSSFFGVGNAHFRTGIKDGFVDTVAFGLYKKEVFDKIGLFDEELIRNQDDEFNFRLTKNNLKIFLSSELRAKYYVRSGFLKLFRQYFQYGYWKVYVNRKHNSITSLRQLVPFAFVCFLVFFGILSIFSNFIFWIFISVLAFYFFTGLFISFKYYQNILGNLKVIWSFFLLHLGYGLGYLKGVLEFIVFRKKMRANDVQLTR